MNLRVLALLASLSGLLGPMQAVQADNLSEYRLKSALLFNFVRFTEWPAGQAKTYNLCVYGPDPFGAELDKLHGRIVSGHSLAVSRTNTVDSLGNCQVVFITRPMIDNLPRVLDSLSGKPVLTVADSPGAARQGAVINMITEENRVTFEANYAAARDNGLVLNSNMLRLAKEVYR